MISILIPVFNRDVTDLICELSKQAAAFGSAAEIIVMDDGSQSFFLNKNAALKNIQGVQYIESGKNNGRIKIRQMLAEKASFEWLLFVDDDSKIISDKFLSVYYNLTNSADVILGGRIYHSTKPAECTLRLHWKYGTYRERIRALPNSKAPDKFMTNNFLISKSFFNLLKFPGNWQGYGHEDTLMGIQLGELGARIKYTHNPVIHEGLEAASVFILKTRNALENLHLLARIISPGILRRHVKLYNYYQRLSASGLTGIFMKTFPLFLPVIEKNLLSCNPSLFLFDVYRLYYIALLQRTTLQR